jgi:signal transduction histidine kinase
VELLKLESVSDAQQDRIAKIEKELERIVKIVGSLLSFSRVRVPRSSRVDMGDVVEEVLLLLGHKLGEKHVELERHLLASSPVVMGDENRLKQVVMNLLVNSIESVLDYGHIEVRVESSDDRGYCEVSISDDGHGIPPEIQDEIFTPFYSTKTYKSNTGLGLAICQHLVEAHGGVLTFDSTPGEYTTFVIRLPLADASVASSSIA